MANPMYDIIFAGGGTSACIIAGRLAAADPNIRILLVEAGKNTKGLANILQPALCPLHLSPASTTLTYHQAKPSDALVGRAPVVPIAHCFGGGSSINFQMYTRASASDYDDWETLYQNPGWGSKDLIPLAQKLETYQIDTTAPTHGADGPLKISYGSGLLNVGRQFLETTKLYEITRKHTEDVNDFHTVNAFGRWPKYIDQRTGTRSDVAHHYIYDQPYNKNIHILEEARVKRILFEGTKAVGIEWVKERSSTGTEPNTATDEQVHIVNSSKLVVLSAGALGSPAILERSGIGAENMLKNHNIDCFVDLPAVGENYMDHSGMLLHIEAADETECLDDLFTGKTKVPMEELVAQWKEDGSTLLAHNAIDAGIKFRPDAKELALLGPEFRERWETFFAPSPDKPVMWIGVVASSFGVERTPENADRQYYLMDYWNKHPASRGYAHISSSDPHAPLDFHAGFLDDPVDTAVLRYGYKKAREWARRMPIYRGEHPPSHPAFPETSNARLVHRDGPYPISEPDIEYSAEDDALIDEFTRRTVTTNWHSLGTCAMRPRDRGGVVDPALNVYGVQGLKVADGSICPSNVAANTNNTVLIIGEKAAIIIASELGIRLE